MTQRSMREQRAAEAVWRIESAALIAGLGRIVRDIGVAEDLAQDALVAALEQWPRPGVPDNPGAGLMATEEHRAIPRSNTYQGEPAASISPIEGFTSDISTDYGRRSRSYGGKRQGRRYVKTSCSCSRHPRCF